MPRRGTLYWNAAPAFPMHLQGMTKRWAVLNQTARLG
jgi:hypothetical protein